MGGEFDFSKSQISTISLITPGRGEVGVNIDRCIKELFTMQPLVTQGYKLQQLLQVPGCVMETIYTTCRVWSA